jgi:tetraacyldisaccharide 4'-kinase
LSTAEAWARRHWWRQRPSLLSWLLWPLTLLYRGLFLWHQRLKTPIVAQPLPAPVLVVGNWVAGGAGKTPTVIALVQALQRAGRHPGVISRGYGRAGAAPRPVEAASQADEVGDEPLLIQRRTGVPVWVGRARAQVARALCAAEPAVDVIVSDDGLQHPALPRHAACVVFDERGAGNGLLLPAGPLREPLPGTLPPRTQLLYTAGAASTPLPGHLAQRVITHAWPLTAWARGDAGAAQPLASLRGRPLLAAAGLAAPDKFFGMLRAAGLMIEPLPLPDHHPYPTLPWPADTADVITTEKDAVKLLRHALGATNVWVVPLDLQLPDRLMGELLPWLQPPSRFAP